MKNSIIKSHAKINVSLSVVGKLQSNLHKIESIVTFINIYDLLSIKQTTLKKHKISFKGKFSKKIGKKNTISKLLKELDRKNLLKNKKFNIVVNKNIPQKSGLGGGSMNASSLLNFFLKKKIINLKEKALRNIANSVGSDVILGIKPKNIVLFSNKKLIKIKKKLNFHILIVKPNFGCSTQEIYSGVKIFSKPQFNYLKKTIQNKKKLFILKNDLENVVYKRYPVLFRIKLFLLKLPNIKFVRMSGSGSSMVAYFDSKKAADIGAKISKEKFNSYWCIKSKTI